MNVLSFVAFFALAQGTSIFELALDACGLLGATVMIVALARG